jgi:hypothetical protein
MGCPPEVFVYFTQAAVNPIFARPKARASAAHETEYGTAFAASLLAWLEVGAVAVAVARSGHQRFRLADDRRRSPVGDRTASACIRRPRRA